jgi:tetratricopeptide (TPR) repeat protein
MAGTDTNPGDSVALNRAIIARAPDDVPAHNRLGRAYQELGLIEHARSAFDAVIRLDPTNVIARKRLQELNGADRQKQTPDADTGWSPTARRGAAEPQLAAVGPCNFLAAPPPSPRTARP